MRQAVRCASIVAAAALSASAMLLPSAPGARPGATESPAAEAEESARRRLSEAERERGPDSLEAATALLGLASVLEPRVGRIPEGTGYVRRAIAIREARLGGDHPDVAAALENLSTWLWIAEEHEAGLPIVERALAIRERQDPPDFKALAFDVHNLSDIHRALGDYGRALELRERSGPLIAGAHGPLSEFMAVHFYYLSVIQGRIGDLDASLASARKAVVIRERMSPLDEAALASSFNLLGSSLLDLDELDPAQAALESALALWERSRGGESTEAAVALANLGRVALARRDWSGAAGLFARVERIRAATLQPGHTLHARALAQLGAAERGRGNTAAARAYLLRALDAGGGAQTVTFRASALREKALVDFDDGRFDESLAEALAVERLTREFFRAGALGLSERESLVWARALTGGLDIAWTCAARRSLSGESASRLFDEAIRSRTLVLDTLAARRRVLALHGDSETAARVAALAAAQRRLTDVLLEGSSARLATAQAASDRAERSLAERSREYREERDRGQPGLADVRVSLPEGATLVSYFRYDTVEAESRYLAIVFAPGQGYPVIVPLEDAATIDRLAAAWHDRVSEDPRLRGVGASERAYLEAARRLTAAIWDPLTASLGGVKRVFVVPDGALHRVNFAALVAERGGYLVEEGYEFHYFTAERDIARADGGEERGSLLAIGDPAFASRFDPLPGSRREAFEVAAAWIGPGTPTVLTGGGATEAAFKTLAPQSGVLHVATHAFFSASAEDAPSPLSVAGLALARGGSGAEDGLLTAGEIALMDLRGVDWAVLSACASGGGTLEPGEGVLGLRRAFQIAGARSLIVSLWPVEDDATRIWMRTLYRARAAGRSTVEAVGAATRAALHEQRRGRGTTHPYGWGGFVSVGDWR